MGYGPNTLTTAPLRCCYFKKRLGSSFSISPPDLRACLLLQHHMNSEAAIAQLGERETEDLKVPSSILGLGSKPSAPRTAGRIRDDSRDAREGPVAFLCRVSACADGVCFTLAFEPSWFLTGNATSTNITARGRTRIYTWPGSNWRPSACWADVIATRPQVHIFLRAALFSGRCVHTLPLCQPSRCFIHNVCTDQTSSHLWSSGYDVSLTR